MSRLKISFASVVALTAAAEVTNNGDFFHKCTLKIYIKKIIKLSSKTIQKSLN